jgi:hypothetical protein
MSSSKNFKTTFNRSIRLLFSAYGFGVFARQKVVEMNDGDGCTTV